MNAFAQYDDLTAEDLRDELRARELMTSGTKPELVARLRASDQAAATAKPAGRDATVDKGDEAAPPDDAAKAGPGECVVDDGTPHTGRAVNGVICSAHAMHYDAQGRRRGNA